MECNCVHESCTGSLRLSYEGEMSDQIGIFQSTYSIINQLRSFKTIKASEVNVTYDANTTICANHRFSNFTFYLQSFISSLPRINIFGSVFYNHSVNQIYFNQIAENNNFNQINYLNSIYFNHNTNNSVRQEILSLSADDGRSSTAIDRIKLCNGVGKCDYASGLCQCPFGYVYISVSVCMYVCMYVCFKVAVTLLFCVCYFLCVCV